MSNKITNFFIASKANDYHPRVLSYQAFIIYGILLLLIRIFLGTLTASGAAVDSEKLMELINQERVARNISALFTNQKLLAAAGQKTQDMIDRDYFAHIDPDGNYVWNKIVAAGYVPYRILGENLAINFTTSEGMVEAWLQSPKHRENLLNPDFVDQGLNANYGDYQGRYTNLATSLFGALVSGEPESDVKAAVEKPVPDTEEQKEEQPPVKNSPPPADRLFRADTPAPNEIAAVPVSPPAASEQTPPVSAAPFNPSKPAPAGLSALAVARVVFTLFGLFLLVILSVDAVIIHRHELQIGRSHSGYHLFNFFFLVLISVLIWWW